jgi:hypothetical protein
MDNGLHTVIIEYKEVNWQWKDLLDV